MKNFKRNSELFVTGDCEIFLFVDKGDFGNLVGDYNLNNSDWFLIG